MNNLTKVKGTALDIGPIQSFSDRFSKRTLVIDITDNPKYPNYLSIEFTNDKAELLNNLKKGDEVLVTIALRGRAWDDKNTGITKYFNSLEAIGIEYAQVNDVRPIVAQPNTERVETNLNTKQIDNQGNNIPLNLGGDDLPF
jgi:single-stranded DNA-binding protein